MKEYETNVTKNAIICSCELLNETTPRGCKPFSKICKDKKIAALVVDVNVLQCHS